MRQVAVAFILAASLFVQPGNAQDYGACDYNGRKYSAGATVCECPSFSARKVGANFNNAEIKSRRLFCTAGMWDTTKELCIDLEYGNSNEFSMALDRLSRDLCQAAIGAETPR